MKSPSVPARALTWRSGVHPRVEPGGLLANRIDDTDHVEHGIEWSLEKRDEYTAQNYHKPSDEFDPSWDLSGAVDDVRLFFRIGYRLAHESRFPNWREGTEFKAARDMMIAELRQ